MKVLFDNNAIQEKLIEIAAQIDKDFENKSVTVVCILKGAFMFMSDLVKYVKKTDINIEFMAVSSYGNETRSSGKIKIIKDVDKDLTDENIIIVEDIVDTGLTIDFLVKYFKNKGAGIIKVCTCLDKEICRKVKVPVDYKAFTIDDKFVIGYGLDYAQKYRNLPYIAEMEQGDI